MNRLPIFEGVFLTTSEAEDLAIYWKDAGDTVGFINEKGHMETSSKVWKRPLAGASFKALYDALKDNDVVWATAQDNQIRVDFSQLHYNLKWLKYIIKKYKLGVSDCTHGLLLFEPKICNGQVWYEQQRWEMKGVTVKALGLTENDKMTCPVSPIQENPDYCDYRSLYFFTAD